MAAPPKYNQPQQYDLARLVNSMLDRLTKLEVGAKGSQWYDYIPTWSGLTTNPVIGNGALYGRYMRVGQSVTVNYWMRAGSTTTFGSGLWYFSLPFLPVQVVNGDLATDLPRTGSAAVWDASAVTGWSGSSWIDTVSGNTAVSNSLIAIAGSNTTRVDATHPMTWTTSDQLVLGITYETSQ